jgi:multidrug efflux pump subunit AcrA (membrane-fusion protein)
VAPGTYTVRLTADGHTASTTVEVREDPRVRVSPADLDAQRALALEIRDALSTVAHRVIQIRALRAQVLARLGALPAQDGSALAAIRDRLAALEARYQNPAAEVEYDIQDMRGGSRLYSRLNTLYAAVRDGDGAPTQGMREVQADTARELAGIEADWATLAAEVPGLGILLLP